MRALLQRVQKAEVVVDNRTVGKINQGWLILLGVCVTDTEQDLIYLVDKCLGMRAFTDKNGKMNLSIIDIKGEFLVVSQFTLYADTKKGRRPSFTQAAPPSLAEPLYEKFCAFLAKSSKVERGVFGAHMDVSLVNDGPVTIMIDSQQKE